MGVLNKLKGRLRGPGKMGEVYGFSTGKERDSGVNAVGIGLAAGQAQQAPVQSNPGQDIHDGLAAIGAGLAAASDGKDNRKKELDKLQKDNPDMTRGEARKKRRKIKEMDKANEKYEKSLPKGEELEAGIKNITDKGYDTKDTCKAKGGTLGFMGRDEATGKGFGECSV